MKALQRLPLLLVPLWLALASGPAHAAVSTQCPPDTDGVDTDGDGNPANDIVCIHLAAGDGFVNMADGRLHVHLRLLQRHRRPRRAGDAGGDAGRPAPRPPRSR